jgi:hypothetical protein
MPRTAKNITGYDTEPGNQTDLPAANTSSSKRKRLNLDLAPAAYDLLQQIATDSGRSMTDVLRTGLALVGIAQEEAKKGRSLGIVEGDRVIKEIILP